MTTKEAKDVMRSYLLGTPPPVPQLDLAIGVLNADKGLRESLEQELGLAPSYGICESFAERVAEFCELGPAARQRLMPSFASHVPACHSCRSLYRGVQQPWITVASVLTLPDPLALVLSATGRLLKSGLCPDELPAPRAQTLADEDGKKWRFVLNEVEDLLLTIDITPDDSGVEMAWHLEGEGAAAARPKLGAKLVRLRGTREIVEFEGPFQRFDEARLSLGSWKLQLSLPPASLWEIPLELGEAIEEEP